MSDLIGVREALESDRPFIASSWFESYWKATARQEGLAYGLYQFGQGRLIDALLARSRTLVVHAAEMPDEILGYAVLERDILHYAYIKSVYRRRGIALGLIRKHAKSYTHKTRLGEKVARALSLTFDPYGTYP